MLPAHSKLELPLWIGIAMSQRNIVELKKPPFLTTQFFNTLQAGADVVKKNHFQTKVVEGLGTSNGMAY